MLGPVPGTPIPGFQSFRMAGTSPAMTRHKCYDHSAMTMNAEAPLPVMSGKRAFLDLLRQEGVTVMFGNPGTTELPLMGAFAVVHEIRYILGLQEAALGRWQMAMHRPPAI
jgi:hypothetical protein